MRFRWVLALTFACALFVLSSAHAEHFTIELKVETADGSKVAKAETFAPGVKPRGREVLMAKPGQKITARWVMANSSATKTAKNVLVHFFVVKLAKAGQTDVPKLTKGVIAESAVTIDFAPKDQTKGELTLVIEQAGVYLVRLETIGASAPGVDEHEHFAALDVAIH